ncbi:NAD(P)H-quinone oxidoreductase [Devosia sp.]|uniref:NAD(P)H-quinone oxidoreductase n=1 Tax=Devosia sp. TaxID=1871048 RepID=UPI003A952518
MTQIPMMRAIAITEPGSADVLQPVDLPRPTAGPGEVVIRVAAAGVNAPDLAQRRGVYDPPPDASPLPGLEVAGEIVAVGDGVERWRVGAAVVALTHGGGYAEYVAVAAGQVLPCPTGWSLIEAAALPETFFTVEQTLVMRAGLAEGMQVLVHGAAGGIGGAAIQLSRLHGAEAIAVVSTKQKADYALSLGARAAIRHDNEDVVAQCKALTDGRGADRIVDVIGGDMLDNNIRAAARFGHIVIISTLSGGKSEINAGLILAKQLTLSGSTLRPQSAATKAAIAASLESSAWPALADGRISRPRIQALPLDRAAAAHRLMEDRSFFGKVVLVTNWGETLLTTGLDGDNPIEMA